MSHCHEHECPHKEVKLCATCGNVYCEVCKIEWSYPWPYLAIYPNAVIPPVSPYVPTGPNTGTPLPPMPVITCSAGHT